MDLYTRFMPHCVILFLHDTDDTSVGSACITKPHKLQNKEQGGRGLYIDAAQVTCLMLHLQSVNRTLSSLCNTAGHPVLQLLLGQTQQQTPSVCRQDPATCVALQGSLYFSCRDCNQSGYQPFLLSNTSGLSFWIKNTNVSGTAKICVAANAVQQVFGADAAFCTQVAYCHALLHNTRWRWPVKDD